VSGFERTSNYTPGDFRRASWTPDVDPGDRDHGDRGRWGDLPADLSHAIGGLLPPPLGDRQPDPGDREAGQ
jgi:hypothetical protein